MVPNGYNMTTGGENPWSCNMKFTKDTIKLIINDLRNTDDKAEILAAKWNCSTSLIKKINYVDASCYKTFINTINNVIIENIDTKERLIFETPKQLKKYFGLKGHDIKQYFKKNQLIFSKWKIVQC